MNAILKPDLSTLPAPAAVQQLHDAPLRASAWRHLAELAERRGEEGAAASAWKQAAKTL